jgi:hypothetical protein
MTAIVAVGRSLFFVNTVQGALYRLTIDGEGAGIGLVAIALDLPLTSLDGLEARGAHTLYAAENTVATGIVHSDLVRIDLSGDRGEVRVIARGLDGPTTFVHAGRGAWVAEGQLDHLYGFDKTPPTLPFRVVRTPLR